MPPVETIVLTDAAVRRLADRVLSEAQASPRRRIVGIAGIAGSGKSTLGERLTALMNSNDFGGADTAVFIPMDGFHLPNATLVERGWKSRKGAAFTYDAEAYVALLRKYANPAAVGGYPVYCRRAHEPVPSPLESAVSARTRVVVTEGQYLLLPEPPWTELGGVLDACWWLDVSPEHARRWLMKRDTAVGRRPGEAEAKYRGNDRLNTEHVMAARREADAVVRWPEGTG